MLNCVGGQVSKFGKKNPQVHLIIMCCFAAMLAIPPSRCMHFQNFWVLMNVFE